MLQFRAVDSTVIVLFYTDKIINTVMDFTFRDTHGGSCTSCVLTGRDRGDGTDSIRPGQGLQACPRTLVCEYTVIHRPDIYTRNVATPASVVSSNPRLILLCCYSTGTSLRNVSTCKKTILYSFVHLAIQTILLLAFISSWPSYTSELFLFSVFHRIQRIRGQCL